MSYIRETSYQYPTKIRRVITTSWVLLLTLNLIEYFLAWARALYAWLNAPLHLPVIEFLQPHPNGTAHLLTAHLGLLTALILARALAFLAPRVYLHGDGLWMSTWLGRRFIPYHALRGVRSTELPNGRFVVWVDATAALPLQNFFAALIFGRWFWRGFLLTSDLAEFDGIIATIAARLKRQYGDENFAARFVETEPTWQLQMLNAPIATIRAVVAAESLPITSRDALTHAISFSTALLLPMIVSAIIHLQIPWGALVVPLLAIAEAPLAAFYLTAVPVNSARRIEFADAWRVYPLTQLPRWLIALALTWLIVAGVPFGALVFIVILAIAPGVFLVAQLTAEWFQIQFPESLLGALVTVIYQVLVYELFLALLPR
jgi:hypothetical protein